MKRIVLLILAVTTLIACGGGTSASKLGKEVCDCFRNANGKDVADSSRKGAQDDCSKKQVDAWGKVKDNQEKADEFNKIIGDCSKDMIKSSLGQ